MDPILDQFTEQVKKVELKSPVVPYLSNVTGTWVNASEATDPSYWAKHLRHTMRFADGVGVLLQESDLLLLEVGPGRTLGSLSRQHSDWTAEHVVVSSLRHPRDVNSDVRFLLDSLGQLWLSGVQFDWSKVYVDQRQHRIPLPTYPFERPSAKMSTMH